MTSINLGEVLGNREQILLLDKIPPHPPGAGEVLVVGGDLQVYERVSLSREEEMRAEAMLSESARKCFVAGRRLLRGILSGWMGRDTSLVPIEVTSTGKPVLRGGEMLRFSISHSRDRVIAAFSASDVGIDLEWERPVDAHALATRYFSPEEAALVEIPENYGHFFRLWTCREAAVKADGRGLGALLGTTRVKSLADGTMQVEIDGVSWTSIPIEVGRDCHLALAFSGPRRLISWCDLV